MTSSAAESDIWGGTIRGRTLLKSDFGLEWKFCGKSKLVIHYPIFTSTKTENKAKLACLASEYQFSISFRTFAYVLQHVPSPATAPKMLVGAYQRHLWGTEMMPTDAEGGGSISWTTNKSASTRNTDVAFYPGVYRGVIYIFIGKAANEDI